MHVFTILWVGMEVMITWFILQQLLWLWDIGYLHGDEILRPR